MVRLLECNSQLFGEYRALALLAVRHPGAADGDEAAAETLAVSRAATLAGVSRRGGVPVMEDGPLTVFAWGTDRGGRRCLADAMTCAAEVHASIPDSAYAVDVARGTIWRDAKGRQRLVASAGLAATVARVGLPGSVAVGADIRALARRQPLDRRLQDVALLLSVARYSRPPIETAVAGCLVRVRRRLGVGDLSLMLDVDPQAIASAVTRLEGDGIVVRSGTDVRVRDRSLAARLAAMILPQTVKTWHARLAKSVLQNSDTQGYRTLKEAARSAGRAGEDLTAFRLWHAAAGRALRSGKNHLAVGALREAHRFAGRVADLDAHIETISALGALLRNQSSSADPEVMRIYDACLPLLLVPQTGGGDERRFEILFQMQTCHLIRGDIERARAVSRELRTVAEGTGQRSLTLLARRMSALTALMDGDLAAARRQFEQVVNQPETTFDCEFHLRYGSNQTALALAGLAWVLAVTEPWSGDRVADQAWGFAEDVGHDHTTAHVAVVLATRAQLLGQNDDVARFATTARDLAQRRHFRYWRAWSDVLLGWLDARDGSTVSGMSRIERGLSDYGETGARQALPYLYLLKADAAVRSGEPHHAFVILGRAERYTRPGGTSFYRAEVLGAAARVATALGQEERALELARKAYRTAVAQGAELFCRHVIAGVTELKWPESADVGLLAAVKQRPD